MDLSACLPVLAGLGPWGILIGVAAPYVLAYLGVNVRMPVKPNNPNPPVTPAPVPGPAPTVPADRPVLAALLKLLPLLVPILRGGPLSPAGVAEWKAKVEAELSPAAKS